MQTFPQTRLPFMAFTCRESRQEFKATMLPQDYFLHTISMHNWNSVGPSQSNESKVGRLQPLQSQAVWSRAKRGIACRAQPYVFNLCPKCPVADWQEGSLTLHRKWWGLCPVCNGRLPGTHSHISIHTQTQKGFQPLILKSTCWNIGQMQGWTCELSVII